MSVLSLNLVTILAALLLIAIGFGGCEYHQSAKHEAAEIAAKQQVKNLAAANKDQEDAIASYAAANRKFADFATEQQGKIAALTSAADEFKQKLAETEKQLKAKEDADNAIPDCQKLLQTSLSVCPAHVSGMRERAAGSLP